MFATLTLALALLGCHTATYKDTAWAPLPADTAPPIDTAPMDATSFEGVAHFQSAWDPDPTARGCDLYWQTSGVPHAACDDCIWGFNVTFTYDATNSLDDADCFADLDGTDWTWRMGLSLNSYGYGVPILWYWVKDASYWYPLFVAKWDPPYLTFGDGVYDEEHLYDDETWYYTTYWYGTATVR